MSTVISNSKHFPKYEEYTHIFFEGQILKNNNGSEYKVINADLQREVLFERISDGEKVTGVNPKLFHKTAENGEITNILEWGHGKY